MRMIRAALLTCLAIAGVAIGTEIGIEIADARRRERQAREELEAWMARVTRERAEQMRQDSLERAEQMREDSLERARQTAAAAAQEARERLEARRRACKAERAREAERAFEEVDRRLRARDADPVDIQQAAESARASVLARRC